MPIKYDEKVYTAVQKCLQVEYNSKPSLLKSALDNRESLIVVVDMINGFCTKGALFSEQCAGIIDKVKNFLSSVPKAEKAFARDCHDENSLEFKSYPLHCANSFESALVGELKGFGGIDVPKNSTNAFFELIQRVPDIASFKNIAIIGVCTDICVLQLALTLKAYFNEVNANVNVMTFTELTQTYDSNIHNAALMSLYAYRLMEQSGVKIFKDLM